MDYSVKIVRRNEQITNNWSGGRTTELGIYPEGAEYSKRNFKWRLSSAMVDIEKSEFTHLLGISRLIMIIDGEMRLEHIGHHSVLLKPFEQDSFNGDWKTRSFGKARDFNLMLSDKCSGEIKDIALNGELYYETIGVELDQLIKEKFYSYYCAVGKAEVEVNGEKAYELNTGDFLLVSMKPKYESINIKINNLDVQESHVIKSSISCF